MPRAVEITFSNEVVILNADRSLWWPKERILLATDLHAGKTEHMRRFGVAIPSGSLEDDLARLAQTAMLYHPARLIFLGDLFHSDINREWGFFAEWCKQQPYQIELVRGNHDRFLSDELLYAAEITVHKEPYFIAPFMLRHHPVEPPSAQSVLAGHLHPVVRLNGPAKEKWRLPCFLLQKQQLILPAYGSFTGGLAITKYPREAVYACSPDFSTLIKV